MIFNKTKTYVEKETEIKKTLALFEIRSMKFNDELNYIDVIDRKGNSHIYKDISKYSYDYINGKRIHDMYEKLNYFLSTGKFREFIILETDERKTSLVITDEEIIYKTNSVLYDTREIEFILEMIKLYCGIDIVDNVSEVYNFNNYIKTPTELAIFMPGGKKVSISGMIVVEILKQDIMTLCDGLGYKGRK